MRVFCTNIIATTVLFVGLFASYPTHARLVEIERVNAGDAAEFMTPAGKGKKGHGFLLWIDHPNPKQDWQDGCYLLGPAHVLMTEFKYKSSPVEEYKIPKSLTLHLAGSNSAKIENIVFYPNNGGPPPQGKYPIAKLNLLGSDDRGEPQSKPIDAALLHLVGKEDLCGLTDSQDERERSNSQAIATLMAPHSGSPQNWLSLLFQRGDARGDDSAFHIDGPADNWNAMRNRDAPYRSYCVAKRSKKPSAGDSGAMLLLRGCFDGFLAATPNVRHPWCSSDTEVKYVTRSAIEDAIRCFLYRGSSNCMAIAEHQNNSELEETFRQDMGDVEKELKRIQRVEFAYGKFDCQQTFERFEGRSRRAHHGVWRQDNFKVEEQFASHNQTDDVQVTRVVSNSYWGCLNVTDVHAQSDSLKARFVSARLGLNDKESADEFVDVENKFRMRENRTSEFAEFHLENVSTSKPDNTTEIEVMMELKRDGHFKSTQKVPIYIHKDQIKGTHAGLKLAKQPPGTSYDSCISERGTNGAQ